ncbi:DNA translocase FtsK [Carboxydothermus hydrogenoformans]|uniref:DNA translocase FtsK n=1 Tax=Carboxydothermus hydrogenoformans (strain ATCC BAA-161 / DSM 6008 / Z-2901) TaxID=246194 RepID=Q3ACY0_CARHZ|nr:DNA translocase FtsK [Carboxydothermus hydrogenoformans]ABB14178.1 DNA translocase FtsK [Carboxydothermus hydrogenoformans Z-2901]
MAKYKNTKQKNKKSFTGELLGIFLMLLGMIGVVSIFSDKTGSIGLFFRHWFTVFAGQGSFLLPLIIFAIGFKLSFGHTIKHFGKKEAGLLVLVAAFLIFLTIKLPLSVMFTMAWQGDGGGVIGALLTYGALKSLGLVGTYLLLLTLILIGFLLILDLSFKEFMQNLIGGLNKIKAFVVESIFPLFIEEEELKPKKQRKEPVIIEMPPPPEPVFNFQSESFPVHVEAEERAAQKEKENKKTIKENDENITSFEQLSLKDFEKYQLPPISLLNRPKSSRNQMNRDISENIKILEETLESFGVQATVKEVSCGPAITRYELEPAPGVKVSKIVSLADDIALKLAAADVRIEAPIPGKAAVGIEVPNKEINMVVLREIIETPEFQNQASPLAFALGKDIAGKPIVADLQKMPHLLIAGATGSGKSVCLNTLISSILFRATPQEVKFLMIDPKMVELVTFNGIPHLISPVVTNAKKAAISLRWAVREMERRYELFAKYGVRDITRFNSLVLTKGGEDLSYLPYIVIIIDELADLMMVSPAEVEDSICRLAQMARAAGMHLVVATQRPSVDVITGLIKANIPSRISFAVSSQTDSRTILDMAGAEKLLGKGDMLFFPVGASKPIRVQGAYMSDKEVEAVVEFWKKQGDPEFSSEFEQELDVEEDSQLEEDELLPQAVKIVMDAGHASISLLQRRLRIGYARAARLIDQMERKGIVGGYEGSKPRSVLISYEQYKEMFKDL